MIDLASLRAEREAIHEELRQASAALNDAFPRTAMGLTPDGVKASPEFQAAKRAYTQAFEKLRAFNTRNKKHLHALNRW